MTDEHTNETSAVQLWETKTMVAFTLNEFHLKKFWIIHYTKAKICKKGTVQIYNTKKM